MTLTIRAGSAHAYGTATAGTGDSVGAIMGTSTDSVTGTATGTGAVYAKDSYGVLSAKVNAGDATANTGGAKAVATGGAASVGALTGGSTVTLIGTTTTGNVSSNESVGLQSLAVNAGSAKGYTAVAGPGTVSTVTGTGSTTITGTTTGAAAGKGTGSYVYSDNTYGIRSSHVYAGNAYGSFSSKVGVSNGSGTSAASTIGAISGTATAMVTGTTAGKYAQVFGEDVYGMREFNAKASYAGGYKATAKLGSIAATGGITGMATATISGKTAGANSYVFAGSSSDQVMGIQLTNISAGVAVGSESKLGVATSAGGTVGAITGKATATASETGTAEYTSYAYVRGVSSTTVNAGNATGAAATAGPGTIGNGLRHTAPGRRATRS